MGTGIVITLIALVLVGALLGVVSARRRRSYHAGAAASGSLSVPPGLPSSPYAPQRSFRLLETDGPSPEPASPPRPRLEEHEYVFSDAQLLPPADPAALPRRHDVTWALQRAGHRSPWALRRVWRVVLVVAVVIAVVVGGTLALRHHHASSGASSASFVGVFALGEVSR